MKSRRADSNRFRKLSLQVDALETRELLAAQVFQTMVIDGNMSDWNSVPSYSDTVGNTHDTDHDQPNDTPAYVDHQDVDLLEYKVAYDAENIYFFFRSAGQIGRTQLSTGPGVTAGRYYAITTIDVDQNDVTGYGLHGGGYYPTSNGYDVNAEVEYYNGTFNTAHYLNHGAANSTELQQAFLDQSQGQYVAGNDGPYPVGFMTPKAGLYDYYTQWVYHDNDTMTFVRDKGPVVTGIATQAISTDGHSMEMKYPYKGFLDDQFGNPIIGLGRTLDISFSLEASGELAGGGQWASNTAAPIVGFHLNAPSSDTVGVVRNGRWYLDQNQNFAWNGSSIGSDVSFPFGNPTDKPVVGDWNADGFEDIGVVRSGVWYLDTNGNHKWDGQAGGDTLRWFGNGPDTPIVGDWNGDGRADIGVYRNGYFYLDLNGNGAWNGTLGGDAFFAFGTNGDVPVVGDWNADGIDDVGVQRNGVFYLDQNGNRSWNNTNGGDVKFSFGNSFDKPVIGDWNLDGISDVGVFRSGRYLLDSNGNRKWDNAGPNADRNFAYGNANDIPLGGRWIQPLVMNTSLSATAVGATSQSASEGAQSSNSNATKISSELAPPVTGQAPWDMLLSAPSVNSASTVSQNLNTSTPSGPRSEFPLRRPSAQGAIGQLNSNWLAQVFAEPLL